MEKWKAYFRLKFIAYDIKYRYHCGILNLSFDYCGIALPGLFLNKLVIHKAHSGLKKMIFERNERKWNIIQKNQNL